jgi:hypothetical protein
MRQRGSEVIAKKRRGRRQPKTTGRRILLSLRVLPPFLKELDSYRKPLKLSRSAAVVRLTSERLESLKDPAEKLWEPDEITGSKI